MPLSNAGARYVVAGLAISKACGILVAQRNPALLLWPGDR
jgi:hypothetical protein